MTRCATLLPQRLRQVSKLAVSNQICHPAERVWPQPCTECFCYCCSCSGMLLSTSIPSADAGGLLKGQDVCNIIGEHLPVPRPTAMDLQ